MKHLSRVERFYYMVVNEMVSSKIYNTIENNQGVDISMNDGRN